MFEPYIPEEDDLVDVTGRKDVDITQTDIRNTICNCDPCMNTFKDPYGKLREGRFDTSCERYIPRLVETYKVGEPVIIEGNEFYPVMGGMIPKVIIDRYSDAIIERLKTLNKQKMDRFSYPSYRPFYLIDHFESERRALHIAVLHNAGFYPIECTIEAEAFKIVIEKFIEGRCRRLGLIHANID